MSEPDDPYLSYEQNLGRVLFGKPSRMIIGVWIARLDTQAAKGFYAQQFFDWCVRTGRQFVQPGSDLRRFESIGMIEVVKRDRAIYYARKEHPMWDVFCMVDVVLSEVEQPGQRPFYTSTPERVEKMKRELVRIHTDTAPSDTITNDRTGEDDAG